VGALAVFWSLAIAWLAVTEHLAFNTGYDLATFAQVVWATAQGRPFYTSLTAGTANFLGLHFSPLLAVLAPFYSIWPDARLLLFAQAVVLAAGAIPLFAFARTRLGFGLTLLAVLAYFLYPPLHYIGLFEFHAIAFSVPLLMAAGAALLDERPYATVIWLGLALCVKEEIALIAVGFGLYALLIQRRRRFGAALTIGTVLWTVLLFVVVMPALNPGEGSYVFVRRYGTLGATLGEVVRTLFTHPEVAFQLVATEAKALFLWRLLAPLAGLPLLGFPAVLLTLPTLAYSLLSDYEFQTSIRYHYTAPLIPLLFLAAVVALWRLRVRRLLLGRIGGAMLLTAALVSAWLWSPLPGGREFQPSDFDITEEDRAARSLLTKIPPQAAVVADWEYLPWLANRWELDTLLSPPYELIAPSKPPDYVLTRTPGPGAVSAPIYPWVLCDELGQTPHSPRFAPYQDSDHGLVLSRWLGAEYDVVMSRYDAAFERGLVLVAAGTPPEVPLWKSLISVKPGISLPVWVAWAARQRLDQQITFTLHLVDERGERMAQVDQEMGGGHFPTTLWHEWMEDPVVVGEFKVPIPPDLPPGRYRLLAGAYESDAVVALVRPDGTQWVELATVEVR
jgi:uncharacterized membrane protein